MSGPAYEWDVSGGESTITSWDTLRDAFQAQIVAASGLLASSVIWEDQNGDRPDNDFIGLRIRGDKPWAPATPEQSVSDNPSPGPGQEIIIDSTDDVDIEIEVHSYTSKHTGSGMGVARLAAVRAFLGREDVTDALDESDVALIEVGAIQNLSMVLQTQFESRAFFVARIRVKMGAQQKTTYIQTTNAAWDAGYPKGTLENP